MIRYGFNWANKKTVTDDGIYSECWYTDITFMLSPLSYSRFCIARYDGVPYFLLIIPILMFRFGKSGNMEWFDDDYMENK